MEEITRQKPRASFGMFRSSFASCSSRTLSDVVEKSVFFPHRNSFHSFPAMCRANTTLEPVSRSGPISIPKVPLPPDDKAPVFTLGDFLKGRLCPAASMVSQLNHPFHDRKKNKCEPPPEEQWFSSDDEREEEEEDETDTLFSSRSFSSDSSGSRLQRWRVRQRRQRRRRRRRRRRDRSDVGVLPMDNEDGNSIRGSFAVVKKSSDPYADFRSSMVEMIIEKQIFGANELEKLLQCFLSLNSHHHHKIIIEVFTEIWEAFFPHWPN